MKYIDKLNSANKRKNILKTNFLQATSSEKAKNIFVV